MRKCKKQAKKYEDFSPANQAIIEKFKNYLQKSWKMGLASKYVISLEDDCTFSLIWDRDEWEYFCVGYVCCLGVSPTEANNIVKFAVNNNFWLK